MRKLLPIALCMLVPLGLVACSKKAEKTPPTEPVKAAIEPTGPQLTQADMLTAMLRGHPNSKQVCVDGDREHAFFLDYGPIPPLGTKDDGKWHGWLFIEKIDFFRTSNNTWFITNQSNDKYVQVYPEVLELTCKSQ